MYYKEMNERALKFIHDNLIPFYPSEGWDPYHNRNDLIVVLDTVSSLENGNVVLEIIDALGLPGDAWDAMNLLMAPSHVILAAILKATGYLDQEPKDEPVEMRQWDVTLSYPSSMTAEQLVKQLEEAGFSLSVSPKVDQLSKLGGPQS